MVSNQVRPCKSCEATEFETILDSPGNGPTELRDLCGWSLFLVLSTDCNQNFQKALKGVVLFWSLTFRRDSTKGFPHGKEIKEPTFFFSSFSFIFP